MYGRDRLNRIFLQVAVAALMVLCGDISGGPIASGGGGDDPPSGLDADILGYLQFQADACDSTGQTGPMTLVKAPIVNNALYLTGIYQYGNIGGYGTRWRIPELNKNSFTLVMQFCPLDDREGRIIITIGGSRWISLSSLSKGTLRLALNNNRVTYFCSGVAIDTCQWRTLVLVVDVPSRKIRIVINGQSVETIDLADDFRWNTDPTGPADFTFTGLYAFYGYVDNLVVYGRALSEDEVADLMETMTFSTAIPYIAPEPQPCVDPDSDGDGLTDREEDKAGTHPFVADTDSDGLSDADETPEQTTDPLWADSDGDGLLDSDEILLGTHPRWADSDEDALWDGFEAAYGYDPLQANDATVDTDSDGLSDLDEQRYRTDPHDPDSDGDGLSDGDEDGAGTDPTTTAASLPIAYYQFESSAADSMGHSPDFELKNTYYRDGSLYLNGTYEYEGQSGWGYRARARLDDFHVDSFTICFDFYRLPSNDSRNDTILDLRPWFKVWDSGILSPKFSNFWRLDLENEESDQLVLRLMNPEDCRWNNLILSADFVEKRIAVYFNGEHVQTATLPDWFRPDTENWWNDLSFTDYGRGSAHYGYIDNFIVFNETISPWLAHQIGTGVARIGGLPYIPPTPKLCDHPDSDGDGLADYEEFSQTRTNPNDPDTDGDGTTDSYEVALGYDPLQANDAAVDTDSDGFSDQDEQRYGTDPNDPDSDDDGIADGDEQRYGTDLHDPDSDDDGISDGDEVSAGSDPVTTTGPLPIAYYQFESSAADSMGHSPDFELKNTYHRDGSLYLNGTYEYEGQSGWGYRARARLDDFHVDSFTICFDFYRLPSNDSRNDTILDLRPWFKVWDSGILSPKFSNFWRLDLENEESDQLVLRLMNPEDCRWNNLILSADFVEKRIAVHLNGEHVQTATLPDWFRPDTENWRNDLTFTDYGSKGAYYGYVDNVIVFNEMISPWLAHQIGTGVARIGGLPYIPPTPKLCEHPDSDGDGLTDYEEFSQTRTNPNDRDTDGDGILDCDETYEPVGRRP